MHFKCENELNRYVDLERGEEKKKKTCVVSWRFEPHQAMLNPLFKGTQQATKVGAG